LNPEGRFCWDAWHVPGQYSLLRTPAGLFFPESVYKAFLTRLLEFAGARFGCRGMTPAWLSLYVDGCEQQWHADLPHGPWAFVYSLTLNEAFGRDFTGGETLLLQEGVLDYWSNLGNRAGVERQDLLQTIAPRFDRLIVFDPRVPHSVSPVRGTRDPLRGRLVLHGWFSEPSPFLEGALSAARATKPLNLFLDDALPELLEELELPPADGNLVLKIRVTPSGQIAARGVTALANTVRSLDRSPAALRALSRLQPALVATLTKSLQFPKASGSTEITLPLLWKPA